MRLLRIHIKGFILGIKHLFLPLNTFIRLTIDYRRISHNDIQ